MSGNSVRSGQASAAVAGMVWPVTHPQCDVEGKDIKPSQREERLIAACQLISLSDSGM